MMKIVFRVLLYCPNQISFMREINVHNIKLQYLSVLSPIFFASEMRSDSFMLFISCIRIETIIKAFYGLMVDCDVTIVYMPPHEYPISSRLEQKWNPAQPRQLSTQSIFTQMVQWNISWCI